MVIPQAVISQCDPAPWIATVFCRSDVLFKLYTIHVLVHKQVSLLTIQQTNVRELTVNALVPFLSPMWCWLQAVEEGNTEILEGIRFAPRLAQYPA